MLKEKIQKYFAQFPNLRVLFFFDPKMEHTEEVDQLSLENIRVIRWDNNNFFLKVMLYGEWAEEKVFLHLPLQAPRTKEDFHNFPLLGLLAANKELSLDDVGEFMDEFQLQRHQKSLVVRYMRELKYSTVQDVLRPILKASAFEEPVLIRGLVSAFLRFTSIMPWSLLLGKMLTLVLPKPEGELGRFQNKIQENGLLDVLSNKSRDYFGQGIKELSRESLLHLLKRIYYNQITQSIPGVQEKDPYRELKIKAADQLVYLNQFLQDISRHSLLQERLAKALELVAPDIQGVKLIEAYGPDAEFAVYSEDMLWEIMALEQHNLSTSPSASIKRLEQLSLQAGLSPAIADSLQFMIQAARMFERINAIPSYILNTPDAYISAYVEDWMLIDMAYRKAIKTYRDSDLTEAPARLQLDSINDELNSRYERHLDEMNREWLRCLNQFEFDYRKISAPKQYDFYQTEVAPYDQKVVVIISDALRYEAAVDLLGAMHGDPKNTADIRYQLASIPSKTSIGMAQLLPHRKLLFNKGSITADGVSTEGVPNRHQILVNFREEAMAVAYTELQGMNREAIREIFKNKVVYIYHDVIDSRGDKRASERQSFKAVDDAVNELKKLAKSLHATYNVAKVLITADHGFLYYDREIEEKDKENLPQKDALLTHNRYVVSTEHATPEMGYVIPMSATTRFQDNLYVTIPQSVNRYKKQGVGHQFVHGGGSLQEVVVPIIESSRRREEIAKKVKPVLIQRGGLRIVSSILRTQLLQENKVSRYEKEITLSVGLYKDLSLVSNEQVIVMNATADAPSERMHRVELTLAASASKESFLKLKVFDVDDKLNPLIEELVQNSTLIQTDF